MKMPFGKYKGKYLDSIPGSYLQWVKDKVTLPALELRINAELEARRNRVRLARPAPRERSRRGTNAYSIDRHFSREAMLQRQAIIDKFKTQSVTDGEKHPGSTKRTHNNGADALCAAEQGHTSRP